MLDIPAVRKAYEAKGVAFTEHTSLVIAWHPMATTQVVFHRDQEMVEQEKLTLLDQLVAEAACFDVMLKDVGT